MKLTAASLAIVVAFCGAHAMAGGPAVQETRVPGADGVSLYVRTVGVQGPVVVAPFANLHGRQLDALGESARLVLFDPRGRGRSDAVTPDKVSLDHLLRDYAAIQDWTGASSIILLGWSGAGMETFVYTLRNPGRVSRLVQLAPIGPRAKPFGDAMMQDRGKRTDQAARTALVDRWRKGAYQDRGAALCREVFLIDTPATLANPSTLTRLPDVCDSPNEWPESTGPYFTALLGSLGDFDWRKDLASVRIPRLVIHGAQDNIPLAASREWVAGQPQARLMIVPRSGHWPQYEAPDVAIGAIREFIAGNWPAEAKTVEPPAASAGD